MQFRGPQVSAKQFRTAQIGLAQIRAFELRFRKIAISQIRVAQVRAAQVRVAELGSTKVGFPQVASREVGAGQVAFLQVGAGQVRAGKIGALPARIPFMEFLVRVQNILQLLAFVSNGLRLPRPQVSRGNRSAPVAAWPCAKWIRVRFYSTEIGEARKLLTAPSGKSILPSGEPQGANREIGVPGWPEGLTTSAKTAQLASPDQLAH